MKKQIFEIQSKDELKKIFNENKGILIFDFYSPTCGPCIMLDPVLEELADKGYCSVAKINIFENEDIATEYKIRVTPTIMIIKNQEIKQTVLGYQPFEAWAQIIEKLQ